MRWALLALCALTACTLTPEGEDAAAGGGESTREYSFGATDPYFLGRNLSAGVRIYHKELRSNGDFRQYDSESTGGGLTFGLPITENFRAQVGYKIDSTDLEVPGFNASLPPPANCPINVSLALCQSHQS